MTDFQALQNIAILGLNNHRGELPLPEAVKATYRERSDANPALRFLDLASLSHAYCHFATLPKTGESFDALPLLPPETQPTVPDALAESLAWRLSQHTLLGFAVVLFRAQRVLPDAWLLPALNLAATDTTLRLPVQLTLSAKGAWLAELNPAWKNLQPDAMPGRWPLPLQLRQLQADDSNAALAWIIEHWSAAPPEQRAQWLSLLHALPGVALGALTPLLAQERSAKTRRPLRRLLAIKTLDDSTARATALLPQYLNLSKGLLRSKLTIQPPEELTADLQALGIDDQDPLQCNAVKPLLRLGQLLVLAGPENIAACLQQSVADSYATLAGSNFNQELAPFLLEAALWWQNDTALTAWCRHYRHAKQRVFSWANLLASIDRDTIGRLLAELSRQDDALWLHPDVCNWLYQHDLPLDSVSSRFLCRQAIEQRNYALLLKLAGLLQQDVALELSSALEIADPDVRLAPELLTILRLRTALENDL